MQYTIVKAITCIFAISMLFQTPSLYSKDLGFTFLDISKISSYNEDRIAFQHYETSPDLLNPDKLDNSLALLMIIRDKKVYLFQDGYDSPDQVFFNKITFSEGKSSTPSIWTNMVDGSPDYVRVTDRRIEVQRSIDKDWVSKNYKDLYTGLRDKLIKKHVSIFLSLLANRRETDMVVTRKLLPQRTYDDKEAKFAISVTAKTVDGSTVYHAEDSDGDTITETFTVNCSDGFEWGYKSGPNVINITIDPRNEANNDMKQMIGRLTNLAYYGTQEEAKIIENEVKNDLAQPEKIDKILDTLYHVDPETDKMLKKNGIDIEKNVEESSKSDGSKSKGGK
jgi:hypothetical protein